MRELPSGTVTFLFTDVEGSTALLQGLGAERYAQALGEHRRLVREAFARHGGVEVDTQGESFVVIRETEANSPHLRPEHSLARRVGRLLLRFSAATSRGHQPSSAREPGT